MGTRQQGYHVVCSDCNTEVISGAGHFYSGGSFSYFWCPNCKEFATWKCTEKYGQDVAEALKAFERKTLLEEGEKKENGAD